MAYTVVEISGRKGLEDFLSIPAKVYRGDPNWVAPQNSEIKRVLNASKNPYFKNATLQLFVCYQDNEPICRSILVVNQLHWARWNKKSAFFGFFESANDPEGVKSLFRKMEEAGKKQGAEYIEGPFNPNHYSEIGIQIDNFNSEPLFFEPYNPPYYPQLLEETGFTESSRYHTRINTNNFAAISENPVNTMPVHEFKDVRIRKFNIWKMNRDLELMREINNDAFENNPYFLPLSGDEYKFSAKYLFLITYPRHIFFAEYQGKPVGVTQFVLNINSLIKPLKGRIMPWDFLFLLLRRRKMKELIIFTSAIKKSAQRTHVASAMVNAMKEIMKKYPVVASTWISDDNKSVVHSMNIFGLKPHTYYVIYSKSL